MKRLSPSELGLLASSSAQRKPNKANQSVRLRCKLLSQTKPTADSSWKENITLFGPVCFEDTPPSTVSLQLIQEYLDMENVSGLPEDERIMNDRALFFNQAMQLASMGNSLLDVSKLYEPRFPDDEVVVEPLPNGEAILHHRYWNLSIERPSLHLGEGKVKLLDADYYDFSSCVNVGGMPSPHPVVTDVVLNQLLNWSSTSFGRKGLHEFKQRMLDEFDISIPAILKKVKTIYPGFKGISLTSCSRSERLLRRCPAFTVFNHHAFLEL